VDKQNKKTAGSVVKGIVKNNEFVLVVLIVVMCIVFSQVNDGFLTVTNFRSMSRGFAIEGYALIGMAFLLVTGMFDMSIGSVMAFAGYIFTSLVSKNDVSVILALLISVAIGAAVGAINGVIVTRLKVNAFITTLGTMTIFRGLVVSISDGNPIRCSTEAFSNLARASIADWPIMLFVVIILFVIVDILLRKVRWFRQLYFIGGNENSAELTGINVKKMRTILFIISGILAALAGCLSSSRLQACVPNAYAATAMELMVACVIGGCSFNGGRGTMFGCALGHLFLALLDNGMVMMEISIYWFECILGVFLIAVVIVNTISASSARRRRAKEIRLRTLQNLEAKNNG